MTPADAAIGAAAMSACAALLVALLNTWASSRLRARDIAAAAQAEEWRRAVADEQRRQEREQAWSRFEGSMAARLDEVLRRLDAHDERTAALERAVASLPCHGGCRGGPCGGGGGAVASGAGELLVLEPGSMVATR